MQLTLRTHHAMRLLMFCAVNGPTAAPVSRIASRCGMSEAHLAKIAHQLSARGLVETVRGRAGGVRLSRDSARISVGEVIRATECCLQLHHFDAAVSGERDDAARLRGAFGEAFGAFMQVLDRYTIADLVAEEPDLGTLSALEVGKVDCGNAQGERGAPLAGAPASV